MIKVMLRWCMSGPHSGCPFQYNLPETTTIGEICKMVIETNNQWWNKGHSSGKWTTVKICGPNNTFLQSTQTIGKYYHQNECVLIFDAA